MRRTAITLTLIAAVAVLVALASMGSLVMTVDAYDSWSSSRTAGNCADCHGDFRANSYVSRSDSVAWNSNLHDVHRNAWLGGQCNVCHSGSSRFSVFINTSAGASGLPGISCNGCHDGPGTRNHHRSAGETICNSCHGATEPVRREYTNPPYYGNALGQIPSNSCSTGAAPGNENKFGLFGLDNDGDGLYDANDPDCGPAAAPVLSVSPTSLTYTSVTVGTSSSQTVTIRNTGNVALTINSITKTSAAVFTFTPTSIASIAAGGSATLTVTLAPTATVTSTGSIAIASSGGNATVTLSGTAVATPPPAGAADLDIEWFRATLAVDTCTVALRLEVENESNVNRSAPATLVGVQNGTQVYKQTITVSVPADREVAFSFPSYRPTRNGTITWTVTVADGSSDGDSATRTTSVACVRSDEHDEHDD